MALNPRDSFRVTTPPDAWIFCDAVRPLPARRDEAREGVWLPWPSWLSSTSVKPRGDKVEPIDIEPVAAPLIPWPTAPACGVTTPVHSRGGAGKKEPTLLVLGSDLPPAL